MTVNKIGRPSKADARKGEIMLAMHAVAAREGLANATVSAVAEEAGMQRTLVFHYFRDRDSLVDAFIGVVVAAYGDQQLLAGEGDILERVGAAFGPSFYGSAADLAIWQELIALAYREPRVGVLLRALWRERWLPQLQGEIQSARPSASTSEVARVAYALAALVEGHWAIVAQGVSEDAHRHAAREAAITLVESLPT